MGIDEQDALEVMRLVPQLKTEEAKQRSFQLLSAYEKQQKDAGQALWPKTNAAREQRTRQLFQDRERHGLSKDAFAQFQDSFKYSVDQEELRYRVLNKKFFSQITGKDAGPQYDSLKKAYSLKRFGEEITSDKGLFDRIADEYDREDEVGDAAQAAGIKGLVSMKAFADLVDGGEGKTAMAPGQREDMLKSFDSISKSTAIRLDPYRAMIRETIADLKEKTGANDAGSGEKKGYADFTRKLMEVPPEDRNFVLTAIGTAGEGVIDKNWMQKIGENFARGAQDLAFGATQSLTRNEMLSLRSMVEKGASVDASLSGSAKDYLTGISERVSTARDQTGALGVAGLAFGEERVPVSPEIQAEALVKIDEAIAATEVHNQLRQIADGKIDPAKGQWLVTRGLYAASRSVPYTLAAIVPGGIVVNTMALGDQSYHDLRARNPDMPPAQAQAIANVSAPIQAGLENISGKVLTGRLPMANRFMNQVVASSGSVFKRGAVRLGTGTAIEMVQENAQDLTPHVMQGLIGALNEDVPEVQWEEILGDMKGNQIELLFAVLPLTLIGAGVGTLSDYNNSAALMSSPELLRASGVEKTRSRLISDLWKAGKKDEAESMLREDFKDSKKDQGDLTEVRNDAVNTLRAEAREMIAAGLVLENAGILPTVKHKAENEWAVILSDGTETVFSSHQEASNARWDVAAENNLNVAEATRNLISDLEQTLEVGRSIAVEFRPEAMTGERAIEEGLTTPAGLEGRLDIADTLTGKASPEAEFSEAAASVSVASADAEVRLNASRILGMNQSEFVAGVQHSVITLFQGATPLTVVEEKLETDVARMLRENKAGWLVGVLREYEAATGDRLFADGAVDEMLTNQQITEAYSNLGTSYFMSRTKQSDDRVIKKGFRQFASEIMKTRVGGMLTAYGSFFEAVFKRAAKLKKASRDGNLNPELEAKLAQSLGLSEQQQHEAKTEQAAAAILDDVLQANPEFADQLSPDAENAFDDKAAESFDSAATAKKSPKGSTAAQTGADIKKGFDSFGQQGAIAFAKKNFDGFKKGEFTHYSKQAAIDLALKNPNINIQPDGTILGVRHPETGEWAGIPKPSDQAAESFDSTESPFAGKPFDDQNEAPFSVVSAANSTGFTGDVSNLDAYNEFLRRRMGLAERVSNEYSVEPDNNIIFRPDRLYRVISPKGFEDFQASGVIRPNQSPGRNRYEDLYAAVGATGGRYQGSHIVEFTPESANWVGNNSNDGYVKTQDEITDQSPIRIFERNADGSYDVVLDNIGDQALESTGGFSVIPDEQQEEIDRYRERPEEEVIPGEPGPDTGSDTIEEDPDGDKIPWEDSTGFSMIRHLPEAMPMLTQLIRDGVISDTDTIGMIDIDRMRVGEYDGVSLQGGVFFPTIVENLEKRVVWAFNSVGVATQVLEKARKNGGYIKLVLMTEGNVVGNKTFGTIWLNKMDKLAASNPAVEKEFLRQLHQAREGAVKGTVNMVRRKEAKDQAIAQKAEDKAAKKAGRKPKKIALKKRSEKDIAKYHRAGESVKTLKDARKFILGMPQIQRGQFYFQRSTQSKDTFNRKTGEVQRREGQSNYGLLLSETNSTKLGWPNVSEIVEAIEEPAFRGMKKGSVVALLKIDLDQKPMSAKEAGVPEHLSYGFVLKGEPVARFNTIKNIEDDFPHLKYPMQRAGYRYPANSIGFSAISAQQDTDYMAAVESGDMEKAQEMVDQAAKAAGYPIKAFHGTDVLEGGTINVGNDGFWLTNSETLAEGYRNDKLGYRGWDIEGEIREFYIKEPETVIDFADYVDSEDSVIIKAKDIIKKTGGSVKVENVSDTTEGETLSVGLDVYGMTRPADIKSADPVTRDEQGNVIPLSQRFDQGSEDINFSAIRSKKAKNSLRMKMTRSQIMEAVENSSDWKDFYTTYQYLLDEYFGEDAEVFQSILAITSQATSVKSNVSIALRMYGYFKRGEEFDGRKRGQEKGGALDGVLMNLERWRDEQELSGRKIGNYAKANAGSADHVVVDRHVARMLFNTTTPSKAQFEKAEKVLTEIARELGWEPRQVQAAIWAASIRKSKKEPASYDAYLRTLRERGTLFDRVGDTPNGRGIFAGERPARRPSARRGAAKAGGVGFSAVTGNVGDFESRIVRMFDPFQRSPELRRLITLDIQRKAAAQARKWHGAAVALRSKKDIEDERKQREGNLLGDKLLALGSELDALNVQDLTDPRNYPAIAPLLTQKTYKRKDGKEISYWGGRLESPSAYRARTGEATVPAEYDGMGDLPSWLFGGTLRPDEAADELNLGSTNDLWDEIRSALNSASSMSDQYKNAQTKFRKAESEAKDESKVWADAQIQRATRVGAQRENLLGAIRTLDAMISTLPPEVRGKIGGYSKIASLATTESMVKEIERKAARIDRELERWLRHDLDKAVNKLLDRAKPVKGDAGEKKVGKLGATIHDLFDAIRLAKAKLTADEAEAAAVGAEDLVATGNLSPAEEAHQMQLAGLYRLFGGWGARYATTVDANGKVTGRTLLDPGADAARRNAALETATYIYEKGYQEFRIKKEKEKEARDIARAGLIQDSGSAGTAPERDRRIIEDLAAGGKVKDFFMSLLGFEGLLRVIFGESKIATQIADDERLASNQYDDAVIEFTEDLSDLFMNIAGSRRAGEEMRWKMGQKNLKVHGRLLSQFEIITALLMWRQEDGQRHMIGHLDENGKPSGDWHYGQDWVDEAMVHLSPEGIDVMNYLAEKYEQEWDTLNPLYSDLHGVNIPRNNHYSPLIVTPIMKKGATGTNPVTGNTVTGSGTTPGSFMTRGTSIAEPDFMDAVQVYIAHKKEMEYWRAYARFNRDARAIIGSRDLSNAIQGAKGKQTGTVLQKWVDLFAEGGVREATASLAAAQGMSSVMNNAAGMAIVGRVGTLVIQSTQLAAAQAEMPTGAYIVRFTKLMSGRLDWTAALNHPYIQRRIKEMPPLVQQAMEGLKGQKPNDLRHAVMRLGKLLPGMDGLFTAGTFAIIRDYQLTQGLRSGMDLAAATEYAENTAQRLTDRVAQPTRAGTRSLFENSSKSPFAKLSWAFASEGRKNLGLAILAAMTKNGAQGRQVALFLLANATIATVIRSAWRDMRDGDDDEIFDERHWDLKRLTMSILTDPLGGIPVFGDVAEKLVYEAFGEWSPDGNLLSAAETSVPAFKRLFTGEMETETALKDIEAMLSALGLVSRDIAAVASLSHLVRDAGGVVDNVTE